jgi:methyl-accepting chemotaxis protein
MQVMANDSKNIGVGMNEVLSITNHQLKSMQNVDLTTEEQSASAQEIASSANTLASMAQELRMLIENFII